MTETERMGLRPFPLSSFHSIKSDPSSDRSMQRRRFQNFKYLWVGFGAFASARRFCRAFKEVRQYFRPRRKRKQFVSLSRGRQQFIKKVRVLEALFATESIRIRGVRLRQEASLGKLPV